MRETTYRPELDGLRAIAVIAVLLSHWIPGFGSTVNWGVSGVYLFFTISGYVITRGLLKEVERNGEISFSKFFLKRALRIWPIYFLTLAFSCFVWPGIPEGHIWWHVFFASNFLMALEGTYSFPVHHWSLAVEQQFYLLWPFVVAIAHRKLLPWCAAMLVVAPLSRWFFVQVENIPASIFTFSSNLDCLAIGAVIAIAESKNVSLRPLGRWVGGLCAIGFIWVLAEALSGDRGPEYIFLGSLTSGLSLFLIGAASPSSLLYRALSSKPLVFIGKISYGIYIYHMLIGISIEKLGLGPAWTATVAGGFTLLVSTASWYLIERPLIGFAHNSPISHPPAARTS